MATTTLPSPSTFRVRSLQAVMRFLRNNNTKGYLYILPWIFGFLVFYLSPLANTIYYSFTSFNLFSDPQVIGLKNYQDIFTHDEIFTIALRNMLFYVPLATIVTVGGGLFFAVLLAQKFPGNYIFRTILYVPSLLVGISMGTMFHEVFRSNDSGLANTFLHLFSIVPVSWFHSNTQPILAMVAVVIVDFWFLGGAMLVFIAGIKAIDPAYYEAARIDGANNWNLFRYITLPLLAPALIYNLITSIIWHIQVFEIPLTFAGVDANAFSTGNTFGDDYRLTTILTYIYTKGFVFGKFGYAAALATVLFVVTMLLTMIVLYVARRFAFFSEDPS